MSFPDVVIYNRISNTLILITKIILKTGLIFGQNENYRLKEFLFTVNPYLRKEWWNHETGAKSLFYPLIP
ncbi:hypothetical protein JCM30204_36650 [Dysgonomonas termitidis]